MASFFGKLKSSSDAKTPANGSSSKKDPNAPLPTPLERMLQNAGPIRHDGSDKFFGMENFGNTCYCNSVLQCLYYTPPFRENVLAYPQRSSPESVATASANAVPRTKYLQAHALQRPTPPAQTRVVLTPNPQGQVKTEDKEAPEYKKKQALAAGPVVNMTYDNAASYGMPESLFTSMKDIFEAVVVNQNRHGVVSPGKFLEVLKKENEMFRSAMHQDAHEFFNLVLNSVMESIEDHEKKSDEQKPPTVSSDSNGTAKKSDNSVVSWPPTLPMPAAGSRTKWLRDMFEGTLASETRCLTCENVSQRDEPFLDLSVDLEQHSSVTSCLNRFSQEEMLCERNKFHCDNCGGLQEAEKRMKIKRLPQVLALHLKRFKYTEDLQRLQKLFHKVVYPYHLRLFNTTDDAEDPDRLYELYAVVVHIGGGPYHGHYVSIIKTQDRGWLLFDDEMVEPVDRSYVRNFFGDKPGLACAYVLFYRQTTEEEVRREQRMEGRRRASQDFTNGVTTKVKESAEIHRVRSVSPKLSPLQTTGPFTSLDFVTTSPPLSPNGHPDIPKNSNTSLATPISPITPSKRDKAIEEQKKQNLDNKLREAQKKEADNLKPVLEASKVQRAEEERRFGNGVAGMDGVEKDKGSPRANGVTTTHTSGSKDIFRRSKSFKFGSLGRSKEKPTQLNLDETPSNQLSNSAIDETPESKDGSSKEKEKKTNRFSIRKKSFGTMLS